MTERPRVTLFTAGHCPYCALARRLLDRRGVAYREIDLTGRAGEREALVRRTGMRTVPVVFVDDRLVGGYAELSLLDREGGLDALLRPAGDRSR